MKYDTKRSHITYQRTFVIVAVAYNKFKAMRNKLLARAISINRNLKLVQKSTKYNFNELMMT